MVVTSFSNCTSDEWVKWLSIWMLPKGTSGKWSGQSRIYCYYANIPQKNEVIDMVILLKKSLIENFFFSQWKLLPINVNNKGKGYFLNAGSLLLFSCPIQTWDYCGECSFINPKLITFSIWVLTQRLQGTSQQNTMFSLNFLICIIFPNCWLSSLVDV